MSRFLRIAIVFSVLFGVIGFAITQPPIEKPFIPPVATQPGPSTWMLGQPYGNTVGAFNFGQRWYRAGQGLHFGIDLVMPCGTALVAPADGIVAFVDDLGFGSAPHNLVLRHPQLSITTLFGHLLERSELVAGQEVKQGQVVGLSGDPDETCDSRPHLHFEVRSSNFRTTFNPVDYIDASWHSLALIGPFGYPLFEQDLMNPRRWVNLEDQPDVQFGGQQLNLYVAGYPPANDERPALSPEINRELGGLASESTWQMRQISLPGCCVHAWWHPLNSNLLYAVDGPPGQFANIIEWDVTTGQPTGDIEIAPPPPRSPDWSLQVTQSNGQMGIVRQTDNAQWILQTEGNLPSISPDNRQVFWIKQQGGFVPGDDRAPAEVWVGNIESTTSYQLPQMENVAGANWLDENRLLVALRDNRLTILNIFDTRDGNLFTLGAWENLRSFSVAPGGARIMFYLSSQPLSEQDGVYMLEVQPGAQPIQMPWFGAWRWRDANSVFYIPFNPDTDIHQLMYFHIPTRETRVLTDPAVLPFTIANGDWSVAPDGKKIAFYHAADRAIWILEEVTP